MNYTPSPGSTFKGECLNLVARESSAVELSKDLRVLGLTRAMGRQFSAVVNSPQVSRNLLVLGDMGFSFCLGAFPMPWARKAAWLALGI